jgi:hypothetical protein
VIFDEGGDALPARDPCQSSEIYSIYRKNHPGSHISNSPRNMVRYSVFYHTVPFKNGSLGDVLSFHVFGQVIIVLNTVKVIKDLLEKRGEIYSDRPAIPFYEM